LTLVKLDRGREGYRPPRPPNRTGGFPAYGSPVSGFLIGSISRPARPCAARATRLERRRRWASVDRLNQRPPLTPLTSADTMRSVHTEAFTHDQSRASAPCLAVWHSRCSLCLIPPVPHPPSCPPSLGTALLSALLAAHRRCGTMRALTPVAPRQRGRSLRSVRLPSGHPAPTHVMPPNITFLSPRASGRFLADPGFATNEQARHCTPPNRVRHPAGCPFASGCSPPRLAATQLPSATCAVTSHDTDLHRADKRPVGRTHCRA
jgi:hypothetical protein